MDDNTIIIISGLLGTIIGFAITKIVEYYWDRE